MHAHNCYREANTIIAGAETFFERLRRCGEVRQPNRPAPSAERRAGHWWHVIAVGDRERFERRMRSDGFDLEAALPAMEPLPVDSECFRLQWTKTLKRVLELALQWHQSSNRSKEDKRDDRSETASEIPFIDFFWPFLSVARERFLEHKTLFEDCLTDEGSAWLEHAFLSHLSCLGARVLMQDFDRFRRVSGGGERISGQSVPDRTIYRNYVNRLTHGRFAQVLKEFPVLARLLCEQTDAWVENMGEFLERFRQDRHLLVSDSNCNSHCQRIRAMRPFLGDPHHHGRSVISLTLESGDRWIFKPRPVDMEHAFYGLLDWMNQNGSPMPWKLLRVLSRDGYGWVEFLEPETCQSQEQVERYYRRAGMLTALIHVLRGTDCHYENLIADGEYPMLIDLETLMYPHSIVHRESHSCEADIEALDQIQDSVLGTGLLPGFERTPDGMALDVGGFSAGIQEGSVIEGSRWVNINTDQMSIESCKLQSTIDQNAPRLDDGVMPPWDYQTEIVQGLDEMYGFILENRERLVAADGPLAAFRDLPQRFIFRNTKVYAQLLEHSLSPALMRDGADRFIQFDVLVRGLLGKIETSPFWPLSRAEHIALARHDVPMFYTTTTSQSVALVDVNEEHSWFDVSGFERVMQGLQRLDRDEIANQRRIVRTALFAKNSRLTGVFNEIYRDRSFGQLPPSAPPTENRVFLRTAERIGHALRQQAIWGSDRSATWNAPGYITAGQRSIIRPLEYGLYDGGCGVAVFLAGLATVSPGEGFEELAKAALRPTLNQLAVPMVRRRLADRYGVGAGNGMASITYALARCADLLRCTDLLDAAMIAASELTPDRVEQEAQSDVLGGMAGIILTLLAVHQQTGERHLLTAASIAGERLLSDQVKNASGRRAWRTIDGQLCTGFSHGAAGIGFALAKLSSVTDDSRFQRAAQEAVDFERSLFCAIRRNWPIGEHAQNVSRDDAYLNRWCYGAAGIGLARLGCQAIFDDPLFDEEIQTAIGLSCSTSWEGLDHLCCGNFGRLELFLETARQRADNFLLAETRTLAARLLSRAENNKRFEVLEDLPQGVSIPGFFTGVAGIGYQLLRLAAPNRFPSILMFQ